eukprot:jgi/Ulvmu1/44/UM001_0047.1
MPDSRHEPDVLHESEGILSWQEAGYKYPANYDEASIFSKTFFTWASPLLDRGKNVGLSVDDAGPLLSASDRVDHLVATFNQPYQQALSKVTPRGRKQRNAFLYAIFRSHLGYMLLQAFWTVLESAFRIGSPVALRQLVKWLSDYESPKATDDADGWMWAVLLCLFGVGLALAHHQLFWCGMRLGFQMKQQAIAAVQDKVLQLNGATLSHLSTGQIVNLVSNDVRRFDDLGPFWVFAWAGPMETAVVLALIAMEVGIVPAITGVSTLLMVIPLQAKLAGKIAGLRARAAAQTDERVRITGELLEGASTVKMLCWERPFQALLSGIRRRETAPMLRMLLIEASSMALMFFCTPVACLVTFSVAVSIGRTLHLEGVFYVVALLNLPKLWLALFFVKAIKSASEAFVSATRIFGFLSQFEARTPLEGESAGVAEGAIEFRGANFAWGSRAWAGKPDIMPHDSAPRLSQEAPAASGRVATAAAAARPSVDAPAGVVSAPLTLHAPRCDVAPGQFVGVVGEVGSGKSSLLAALLGELQPVPPAGYRIGDAIPGAPVMVGRVAYCQQVPWIEAGSVRENITFGSPFEPAWYAQVVTACALDHDIEALPAGDATEIGERGINLSGGQKARLALARAAYSRPAIALLDDPLSAVDPKVAKTLFAECIGPAGILGHCTRVLVTHQTQWLQACDRVLVLRAGHVVADGHWKALQMSGDALPELLHVATELTLADLDETRSAEAYDSSSACPEATLPLAGGSPLSEANGGSPLAGSGSAALRRGAAEACATTAAAPATPRLAAAEPRGSAAASASTLGAVFGWRGPLIEDTDDDAPAAEPEERTLAGEALSLHDIPDSQLVDVTEAEAPGDAVRVTSHPVPLEDAEVESPPSLSSTEQPLVAGSSGDEVSLSFGPGIGAMGSPAVTGSPAATGHAAQDGSGASPQPQGDDALSDDDGATEALDAAAGAAPESRTPPNPAEPSDRGPAGPQLVSESPRTDDMPTGAAPPNVYATAGPPPTSLGTTSLGGTASYAESVDSAPRRGPRHIFQVAAAGEGAEAGTTSGGESGGWMPHSGGSGGGGRAGGPVAEAASGAADSEGDDPAGIDVPAVVIDVGLGGNCSRLSDATSVPAARGPADVGGGDGATVAVRTSNEESGSSGDMKDDSKVAKAADSSKKGTLTQDEHREKGSVKRNVFLRYFQAVGVARVTVVGLALVGGQTAWIMSDWWLAQWSQASPERQSSDMSRWLGVYGALVACVVLLSLFRNLFWFASALAASSEINLTMLRSVLRARLSFFHTTPTGRILNVFSKDQGSVDEQLPQVTFDALQTLSVTCGAVILIAVANPPVMLVFLPLAYVFFRIRAYYVVTSREVKRIEAVTRSPVYAMFSTTLKGLPTIRAFGAQARFRHRFLSCLDLNSAWWMAYIATARWVGSRMDAIALTLLATAAIFSMAFKSLVSASLLALSLTHLLQLSGSMQWAVRQTAEAENHMTAVERMLGYCGLEQERPATPADGGGAPPPGWPASAALEFRGVSARYRPGLENVLSDLSFKIPSGTTCGIVGRTGSGKSSLMLVLFDLIDVTAGAVLLDGLNVRSVALDSLRRQVSIIPQDPLLFSGSLRANLDPWNAREDDAVWAALDAVQLRRQVEALGGLRASMAEAGGNFSAGQRQLLCLARSLLTDSRILALDEATANVDRQTDAIIQDTFRAAVKGGARLPGGSSGRGGAERIMVVIAHRVGTIMDCDQLLVLADGRIVERGVPTELARGDGTFAQLVRAADANEQTL